MILSSQSEAETRAHAEKMASRIKQGLVCLYGDLGAGKTTFVRGFAKGLGVNSRIASPTFTYERVHQGKRKLYHFDCYRVEKNPEFWAERIVEALAQKDGVVIIEWAEKVSRYLPRQRTEISFEHVDETTRKISITRTKNV